MRWLAVLALAMLGITLGITPARAAPRKILVLPLDGNADAATRARLTARVAKLARSLDGQVTTADATFADTALAVGCDPQAAGCSDEVMATLGVDELVWGTATRDAGQTRLVVRRAARGAAAREAASMIAAGDPPDRVDAGIAPVFGAPVAATEPAGPRTPAAPPGGASDPVPATAEPLSPAAGPGSPGLSEPPGSAGSPGSSDHHDRNVGIVCAAGGGAALVLGLALWASYASLQTSIDDHPTRTRSDFEDLRSLEDRAGTYAIAGDVLVVAGLAVGGLGAYYLLRHPQQRVVIAPSPIGHGAGLTLSIVGGL